MEIRTSLSCYFKTMLIAYAFFCSLYSVQHYVKTRWSEPANFYLITYTFFYLWFVSLKLWNFKSSIASAFACCTEQKINSDNNNNLKAYRFHRVKEVQILIQNHSCQMQKFSWTRTQFCIKILQLKLGSFQNS